MKIERLNDTHVDSIAEFCEECRSVGYKNNSSLEEMKFGKEYDLKDIPKFWALIKENKIISVSGSHRWKNKQGEFISARCLFRSASLPQYKVIDILNKNHMNSVPFSLLMPYQIYQGVQEGIENFYITTSSGYHDASGKMKRTHRALELLGKNGLVEFEAEEIMYSTLQTRWKINLDKYLQALKVFDNYRSSLGIEDDGTYLKIKKYGFQKQ
jgi:hypothetical protein